MPLDIVLGVLAGAAFAHVARGPLARIYEPVRTRYFAIVLLFASGALMPAGLVVFAQYPDWAVMYLFNTAHVPVWLCVPALIVAYLAAPPAGFLWMHRAIVRRSGARAIFGGLGGLAAAIAVLGAPRLLVVAHYDRFHHLADGTPLWKSALLLPLVAITACVIFAFAFALLELLRHVRAIEDVRLPTGSPAEHADTIADTRPV